MVRYLLIGLLALGCAFPPPGRRPATHSEGIPGVVVRINGPGTKFGTGAVVGPHTVATVEHVAVMSRLSIQGKTARRVRTIQAEGWETIVLLEVDWEWPEESIFKFPPQHHGARHGYVIWNQREAQGLVPSFVRPGDSGSPVLDRRGALVGHISAANALGTFTQVGIGSFYPDGVQLNRLDVFRGP